MRLALFALFLCALAAAPVHAADCAWAAVPFITPPDKQNNADSGDSWPSSIWCWQYVLSADHLTIFGSMSAYAYHCNVNLSAAATGNGTYIVTRILACSNPQEDIEGDARNEFTAHAQINDDSYARARGSQRIKGSKMSLDCHACGGVEATSSGYGGGSSGTLTVPLYPGGPNIVMHLSKGGSVTQAFQASDGGTGGRSPETITCQTNVDAAVSVGWEDDEGVTLINDSKAELKVYGTCDGSCKRVVQVINISVGY